MKRIGWGWCIHSANSSALSHPFVVHLWESLRRLPVWSPCALKENEHERNKVSGCNLTEDALWCADETFLPILVALSSGFCNVDIPASPWLQILPQHWNLTIEERWHLLGKCCSHSVYCFNFSFKMRFGFLVYHVEPNPCRLIMLLGSGISQPFSEAVSKSALLCDQGLQQSVTGCLLFLL